MEFEGIEAWTSSAHGVPTRFARCAGGNLTVPRVLDRRWSEALPNRNLQQPTFPWYFEHDVPLLPSADEIVRFDSRSSERRHSRPSEYRVTLNCLRGDE